MSDPLVFAECEDKKNPSPVLSSPEFFYDEENVEKYQQHIARNGEVGNSTGNVLSQQAGGCPLCSGVGHLSSFLLDGLAKCSVRSGRSGWRLW